MLASNIEISKSEYTHVEIEQWYSYFYYSMSSEVASSVTMYPELHTGSQAAKARFEAISVWKKGQRASEGDCICRSCYWK